MCFKDNPSEVKGSMCLEKGQAVQNRQEDTRSSLILEYCWIDLLESDAGHLVERDFIC